MVNFTKEHYAKMKELAFEMLIQNEAVPSRVGTPLTIGDLLHTQSINSLNSLRIFLGKKVEEFENQDEWVSTPAQQEKLEFFKKKKELINLIIGWKRFQIEQEELAAKKASLEKTLQSLKEATKTPEDKIKEIEEQLKALDSTVDF